MMSLEKAIISQATIKKKEKKKKRSRGGWGGEKCLSPALRLLTVLPAYRIKYYTVSTPNAVVGNLKALGALGESLVYQPH